MYRPALRAVAAPSFARAAFKAQARGGKRFASTASSKSGSWRGTAARWGLAGGLIYYYNTSSVFAEEPQYAFNPPSTAHESETYHTVESIAEQRKAQAKAQLEQSSSHTDANTVAVSDAESTAPGDPGALEEEASQQGAFNEETGEINWDCPCLGGMAHGPCGEQFRAAFSCFVFSKEEPKGVDCIEYFKTMQGCFREHPEEYGSELDEDEAPSPEGVDGQDVPAHLQSSPDGAPVDEPARGKADATSADVDKSTGGSDESIPKPWHDSRESSTVEKK